MTEETNEYEGYPQVRALTRKDRKKLSELIKAFAERSGNENITKMIPKATGDESETESKEMDTDQMYDLIKSIIAGLFEWVEEDVTKWFMELIGCQNQEEYDALGFDIEMYILDEMWKQKGFSNFFIKASELFKKVRGSIG